MQDVDFLTIAMRNEYKTKKRMVFSTLIMILNKHVNFLMHYILQIE